MRLLRNHFIALGAVFLLSACSSHPANKDKATSSTNIIDVLTLFVESIQGDRFDKAMDYLSLSERARFDAAGGPKSLYIQRQLKALRLSTLARRPTVKQDPHGLLEGIYDQLPELPYTSETADSTKSAVPSAKAVPRPISTDTSSTVDSPLPDLP